MKKMKKIISSFFLNTEIVSPQSSDLKDTIVMITGASKGLGKGIAEALYNQGASIIALARHSADLEKVYKDFDSKRILYTPVDIATEESVKKAIQQTLTKFGKIDVLINNAGMFLEEKYIEYVTKEEFNEIFSVNVEGLFVMTKNVIPIMKKQKSGYIINVGSKISHNTNVGPKKILYATTKYAVEGFTLALSKELKEFGIRVSCIMPGTINTFISRQSKKIMPPHAVGFIIAMMIKAKDIDFESIVLKSKFQNL